MARPPGGPLTAENGALRRDDPAFGDNDARDRSGTVPRRDHSDDDVPTHQVIDESPHARNDRIRWGAVWAGLVVALATYIVLQLLLIAVGALDVGVSAQESAWWSAAAALVAFSLGGLVAGASAMWADSLDGVLHGTVMWAIAVAAVLVFSVLGGGLVMGALDASGAFDQVTVDLDAGTVEGITADLGADDAREAASWALLGLGAAWLAASLGAVLGALLWPSKREVRGPERRTLVG